MVFINIRTRILSSHPLNKALWRILILYLLALIVIFSYIPFYVQIASNELDGSFILSPKIIEYAWFNPPMENEKRMISGINWYRIYTELIVTTIVAGICLLCAKNSKKKHNIQSIK